MAPVTLYPKKLSAVWLLLACSAFVAGGIWMAEKKGWIGYACAGFFSLGIPVALVQLLPGSAYLQLDDNGLTYCSLFRKKSIPWSLIDEFFVVTLKQAGLKVHTMIGFNHVPGYQGKRFGRGLSRAVAHCEGALPDTYGKKAEELVVLLNSYLRASRAREGT
ncbi:MAG: hypothetical protein U0793_07615 [Gemmataceae bacterium]